MDAQGALSEEGPPARELPRALFLGVALAAWVLLVALCRNVFLFWDDFMFLGEARGADLTRSYLAEPLFRHFSPLSRLIDWVFVRAIPGHPSVILLVQAVLLLAAVASVTWLMITLHGRTTPALVGTIVLAPSLTLIPLGNWWTAGVNILPALAGFYVAFGAMVLILRGETRWWSAAVFLGVTVAVLDYELPMLLVGYLGLWLLLFRTRITGEPLTDVLRRTWWVWTGLTAICLAAALNYRINYYDDSVGRAPLGETLHALALSLVRTLVPTAVGFHDPRSDAFSALSLVIGCLVLVGLVAYLVATREGAWRGLLFAAAGWLLPTVALVLNRLTIYGIHVVDNAIYYHLPTVLVVIGVLESWRAPRRSGTESLRLRPGARVVLVATALVAMAAGYAWSAGPTARYQAPAGTSPAFTDASRASAQRMLARGTHFSVINSDVPGSLVPAGFKPYNRAEQVLGVVAPPLDFDDPAPPYYRFSDTGDLVPVDVQWLAQADPDSGGLHLRDGDRTTGPDGSLCFTATDSSSVVWPLGSEVKGPDLVIRTLATVDRDTPVRVNVRGTGTDGFDRANDDGHVLRPHGTGVLDTVAAASVDSVRVKEFAPGTEVCVDSLAIGRVVPSTQ